MAGAEQQTARRIDLPPDWVERVIEFDAIDASSGRDAAPFLRRYGITVEDLRPDARLQIVDRVPLYFRQAATVEDRRSGNILVFTAPVQLTP